MSKLIAVSCDHCGKVSEVEARLVSSDEYYCSSACWLASGGNHKEASGSHPLPHEENESARPPLRKSTNGTPPQNTSHVPSKTRIR